MVPIPIADMGFAEGLVDKGGVDVCCAPCCVVSKALRGLKKEYRSSGLIYRVWLSRWDQTQYPAMAIHACLSALRSTV